MEVEQVAFDFSTKRGKSDGFRFDEIVWSLTVDGLAQLVHNFLGGDQYILGNVLSPGQDLRRPSSANHTYSNRL